MVAVVMADVQTSLPWFDRNWVLTSNCRRNLSFSCGFSISQGPIFGVPLKANKLKRDWFFGLRTRNCGATSRPLVDGGALEKEFEFKPSFDEYLKTMETVRERRQRRNLNGHDSMKDSWGKDALRTSLSEKDEESIKLRDLEGQSHWKRSKPLEQNELCKKSNGDGHQEELGRGGIDCRKSGSGILKDYGRIKFKEKGNRGNVSGSYCDELGGKEGEMDVNVKMRLDIDTDGGSIKKNGDYQSGLCFGTNKHVLRSNEISRRLEKDYVRAEKNSHRRIASKIVDLSSTLKDNDVQLGMERAAFKPLEVSNDVLFEPRVSRMEMEERIQRLAKCLNGADIDMPAWMFTKMMRSARIRYSDHSILRVIQILGKLGNWRRVLQVLDWMQMKERFKSHKIRYIYTAALDVLGKSRRPVEALNVFYAMQQHMSSYPDLVAYHCIAVTLGQAGHLKELFDVIDSMRSPPKKKFKTGLLGKWDPRLEPDIIVYNAVLNACVRCKQWEGAFWVLQQLKQQGQQPSSTTYGLVMEVMLVCGKYNLVHDFFKKGQKSSMPNALTYKVLVNTLWREGRTDDAMLAVQEMERRGIIGSAGLYYDLARCLCSAGRCKEALMQIDKICKVANKPLVVTYTGLIQACLDAGNVQNGGYIFNHMHKFCSPNLVTCNIMLKAYLDHGMFQEAEELFQKMLENGNHVNSKPDYKNRIIPDIYTFNIMLDACLAEQRWDNLFNVYKQMLRHGCHFNAKRHLRIILDACRAGKVELLETTWKHLAQAGRTPPPLLIKEMFRMKLEHDDYSAALSCISSNQWNESPAFSHKAWLNFFEENGHLFQKDTFVRLINESSSMVSRSESQDVIIQNLITCCREFLSTHVTVSGTGQTDMLNRLDVKQL